MNELRKNVTLQYCSILSLENLYQFYEMHEVHPYSWAH